jgi:DNA-binding winged helix-turn-helix (wHTH) protein
MTDSTRCSDSDDRSADWLPGLADSNEPAAPCQSWAQAASKAEAPLVIVQVGAMVVVRPASRAGQQPDASPLEARTILVVVDSEQERERVVSLLTGRAEHAHADDSATSHARPMVVVDELSVDVEAHRVRVNGALITAVTALEFRLLLTLLERAECVQSRATLLHDVWRMKCRTTTRTVDVHIKRLRDKLGSAGRFIECVRGVGYRFTRHPVLANGITGKLPVPRAGALRVSSSHGLRATVALPAYDAPAE